MAGLPQFPRIALLLLAATCAQAALAQDSATAELKERWENRREEERLHLERRAEREEARRHKLAEMGIAGVEAIGTHGDPAGCVDVVFIGDGFTADEQEAYRAAVARMAENYLTPPFDTYASRINLHRIDLVSKDSGIAIDDPDHETPLGGTRIAFPGGKLLRCDVEKAAVYARTAVPEVDYLQVVLNTHGKFLGSANSGRIVLLSTAGGHQRSIVVHEFAHNFAGLLDEYVDPKQSGKGPPPPRLARGINVSLEPNVHLAKWHLWNIPEEVFLGRERRKPVLPLDIVRCFEGAATFENGVFRSEENCHMQRGRGKRFCRVCREALEVRLYDFFPPMASVDPVFPSVVLESTDSRAFRVTPAVEPEGETAVEVRWYLDGRRLIRKGRPAEGTVLELEGADLEEGVHHLTAAEDIRSPRVRIDRGRLSGSFTWTVTVVPGRGRLGLGEKRVCDEGASLTFDVPEGWVLRHGPAAAEMDAASRTFSWTPAEGDHGGWTLTFAVAPGEGAREESLLILVRPTERRRNRGPKALFVPDLVGSEGDAITFRFEAWDPDGDHLSWTASGLPSGAHLDPNTGEFVWHVPEFARGTYEVRAEVTDGVKRDTATLRVAVRGRAVFRGVFPVDPTSTPDYSRPADRMLMGLHHALPAVRLRCAEARAGVPPVQVLAESLRLFRETVPALSRSAAKEITRILDEAAREGTNWPLDPFLDRVSHRAWQFVNRPEDLALIRTWCETAGSGEDLPADSRRELAALVGDLDRIERYNRERKEWPAPPPITDKKYR